VEKKPAVNIQNHPHYFLFFHGQITRLAREAPDTMALYLIQYLEKGTKPTQSYILALRKQLVSFEEPNEDTFDMLIFDPLNII